MHQSCVDSSIDPLPPRREPPSVLRTLIHRKIIDLDPVTLRRSAELFSYKTWQSITLRQYNPRNKLRLEFAMCHCTEADVVPVNRRFDKLSFVMPHALNLPDFRGFFPRDENKIQLS